MRTQMKIIKKGDRTMKKYIFAFTSLLLFITTLLPSAIYGHESGDSNGIAITVVVPRTDVNRDPPPGVDTTQYVYPVHVWESRDNLSREIIRVYELSSNETPNQIRREPFIRDGFRFELGEVVRREVPRHSVREHTETITINTSTNDLNTIIGLLSQTLDYLSDDGYFGVLALDLSTIQTVSDGTRTTSHSVTRTREFPHLSSTDTSLIPRTITENGRTYHLSNVEWINQSHLPIDHRQVANSFTARTTYSGTANRTANIGYTTTATYIGQVSRVSVGVTEFTVHFSGIPVVSPLVSDIGITSNEIEQHEEINLSNQEISSTPQEPSVIESVTVEHVHIGGIVIEIDHLVSAEPIFNEHDYSVDIYSESKGSFPLNNFLIVGLVIGGITLSYFIGRKGLEIFKPLKKASCLFLAFGLIFSFSANVYGASIPSYHFGSNNREVIHVYTQEVFYSNESLVHSTKQRYFLSSSTPIHFNPTHVNPRASPTNTGLMMNNSQRPLDYTYGNRLGKLTVHRLNRRVNVIAGATMEAMDFGAGHFSFTGLNYGNTVLIGHNRGLHNGFFSFVRQLQQGDILTLEANGITRRYEVRLFSIISETDFSPLMNFGDNRLTLITCVEYQRTQRRVVVAFALD